MDPNANDFLEIKVTQTDVQYTVHNPPNLHRTLLFTIDAAWLRSITATPIRSLPEKIDRTSIFAGCRTYKFCTEHVARDIKTSAETK